MNNKNIVPITSLKEWSLIDEGHFGSVYKAKHTGFKVPVAVKKLKGNVPNGIKELISEAEKMASASASPFVIRLFGILEENNRGPPGIVMEFMEYGSLYTLMERVPTIPWALKFRIIHQVTLGMNWLHNLPTPLLHLDLKTRNVLLNEELHIKITDFGLSRFTSVSSCFGSNDSDGVGGTLEYMPPEAFQDGYLPSTSTDVYSFAILSAVVLRGENPYPVDKSALIRELVPRGQRPSLKILENETSVKYLKEAIELTKHCWDNDKLKRPPFSECCTEWEKFITAYNTCDMRQAVRCVQDKMDPSTSSGKTTDNSFADASSVNTKDMSEMVYKLKTINISEAPHMLTESVPVNYPNMQRQTSRFPTETVQQKNNPQGAIGSNFRPSPTYYRGSKPVMSFPNTHSHHTRPHPGPFPGFMGYNPVPPNYQGFPFFNQPNPTFPFGSQSDFFSQPTTSKTININGCSNFQIGNNSIMNVTDGRNPGPNQNVNYRQQFYTMNPTMNPAMSPQQKESMSCFPTAMSTQPKQTRQGYNNMPEREAPSDQPCHQNIMDRSDQQSPTPPVQVTPQGHSSNACNTHEKKNMSNTENSMAKGQ